MLSSRSFDVDSALAPARRALGMARCARFALRGLIAGACLAALVLALGLVFSWGSARSLAAVFLVAPVLAGLGLAAARWPDSMEAARLVDAQFGLGDRVTTALEFRGASGSFVTLQRQDASRSMRGLPVHRVGRGRPRRREGGLALGLVAVTLALLLYVPAPRRALAVDAAPGAAQRIQRVSLTLPGIARGLPAPQSRQDQAYTRRLQELLHRLQMQLRSASSLPQALRAISVTQQQLQKVDAQLHPLSREDVSQLARSLGPALSTRTTSAPRDASSMARAIARAVRTLSHLSPAQRRQLASALAHAANTTRDSRLRTQLRRAASALAQKKPAVAGIMLRHAVALLNHAPAQQTARDQARALNKKLDQLKNVLSDLKVSTPGPLPTAAARPTAAAGSNRKRQAQSRTAPNHLSKTRRTQAPTKSTGNQQAPKDRTFTTVIRRSKQGGRIKEEDRGRRSRKTDARHSGYIHGIEGKGSRLLQNGSPGLPSRQSATQYHQIVVRYAQTARDALERGTLPPNLQHVVRQYFDTISR